MGESIGKKCKYCGSDNWMCCDNIDAYYEHCCECGKNNRPEGLICYDKAKLVDEFECPECGALSGHAEENKFKFGIRCDHCGKLFIQFEKASIADDNRHMVDTRPKCPTCGSTNIQRISTTKKLIGVATLGLASKTVGKTMQCKKCGYKW